MSANFAQDVQIALPTTEAGWVDLLLQIPDYDCFEGAEGYEFDATAAIRAVGFFEEKLHHIEGPKAKQPFILQLWQQAIVACLFGWKRIGTRFRRYREMLLFVPRKNGKTPFAAGIVLCVLVTDGEIGAQINGYAEDREQAEYVFRQAKGMVELDEELSDILTTYKGKGERKIVFEDTGSVYKIMPSDDAGAHGGNLLLGVVDELHAQPNPGLLDVIESSFGAREQPLLICCTTSDYDRPSICNEKHDYAVEICNDPTIDLTFLPVLYEKRKEDKWNDPQTWWKCNPNLGVSISFESLKIACAKAERTPRKQNAFRRMHLNEKTEQATRWLSMEVWDENAGPSILDELLGVPCSLGIDLSSTQDITAMCKCWKITAEHGFEFWTNEAKPIYICRWQFWVPAASIEAKEKKDQANYRAWIDAGFIEKHTDDVVDFDAVELAVLAVERDYGISGLYIDPANATQFSVRLRDTHGIPVEFFRQGIYHMNDPCKSLERLLLLRQIGHDANPVARWMAGNTAVITDDTDNIKLTKRRSYGRIDGIVAMVQALYAESTGEDEQAPTVGWL